MDSELIARILSFICARLRSTSARFDSVSARLPPVSRWIASVMTKNWNSGVPRRSAVSCSAASIVRPIFILSATDAEFDADRARHFVGDDAERLGDRQARAQAAHHQLDRVGEVGGELVDAALDHLADDEVRQADADEQADEQAEQDRRALASSARRSRRAAMPSADHGIFAERDVLAGHAPAACAAAPAWGSGSRQSLRSGSRARAKSLRICAWALPAMTSPWRSLTQLHAALERLGRRRAARTPRSSEASAPTSRRSGSRHRSIRAFASHSSAGRSPATRNSSRLRAPCPSASTASTSDCRPATCRRRRLGLGRRAFVAGVAQHHARQAC